MSYCELQYGAGKKTVLYRALIIFFFWDVSGVHSTKHTYISVKEGIKYKQTFILWHVSLSIRIISQMALLFHLYFLVGSGSRYWYDSNAFLFSLVNKPGLVPVKLPQTGKYSSRRQYSTEDILSYGPSFGGGHDMYISDFASSAEFCYPILH